MAKYQLTVFNTITRVKYADLFIEAENSESLCRKTSEILRSLDLPHKEYLSADQVASYCVKSQGIDVCVLRSGDAVYALLKAV